MSSCVESWQVSVKRQATETWGRVPPSVSWRRHHYIRRRTFITTISVCAAQFTSALQAVKVVITNARHGRIAKLTQPRRHVPATYSPRWRLWYLLSAIVILCASLAYCDRPCRDVIVGWWSLVDHVRKSWINGASEAYSYYWTYPNSLVHFSTPNVNT